MKCPRLWHALVFDKLAILSTQTQSLVPFFILTEISGKIRFFSCLNRCTENQIFLGNSFVSSTDIHRFFIH